MRRHAKASSADSNQRQAGGLGRIFRGALATRGASGAADGSGALSRARLRTILATTALLLTGLALTAANASAASAPSAGAFATEVERTEAKLGASINPNGSTTTYQFEYVDDAHYQPLAVNPYAEGEVLPAAPKGIGSGTSNVTVSQRLEGLSPATTYHYRVVAVNGIGTTESPDHTIITWQLGREFDTACPNQALRIGDSAALADCRAYEMVSPVDKDGGDAIAATFNIFGERTQSSLSGEKLTFSSYRAFAGAESAPYSLQYLANRGVDGWSTEAISPKRDTTFGGFANTSSEFNEFSPDLSAAWFHSEAVGPLAPSAPSGFKNIYRRNNLTHDYTPLITSAPPSYTSGINNNFVPIFMGASSNGSHDVFDANDALTPEAPHLNSEKELLYERFNGELRLVAILPNGEPSPGSSTLGTHPGAAGYPGDNWSVNHAVSDDGSRIFWSDAFTVPGHIYVRIDGQETVAVSESVSTQTALFWTAASDGSKAIFSINQTGSGFNTVSDLYEFDVDTETPTLIAHNVIGLLGASDDASYIYLASRESLDAGAVAGEPNLYLYHEGAFSFIATLPNTQEVDPLQGQGGGVQNSSRPVSFVPRLRTARVTPDGRDAAFVSRGSLTGYDNIDPSTGEAAAEVYLYDADTGGLVCASCNPSGARPHAGRVFLGNEAEPFGINKTYLAAASIPGWKENHYAGRSLAADGSRLFFDAYDSLVPWDTNGRQDVYEWEAPGSGDCSEASFSYSPEDGGCISLLSTGQSSENAEFIDAASSGGDAFFRTEQSLDPRDPGLLDIYDAREDGGIQRPTGIAACEGEACQSPPEAPNDPTPASSSFEGPGNVVEKPAAKNHRKKHHKRRHAHQHHRANHNRRAAR